MLTTTETKEKAEAFLLKAQKQLNDYVLDHPLLCFLHGRGFLLTGISIENTRAALEVLYVLHIRLTLRIMTNGEPIKYGALVTQSIYHHMSDDILLTELYYKMLAEFRELLLVERGK